MKKLLVVFSAVALVLTLAACKPVEEVPTDLVVTFSGLENQEITVGDTIDLLDGVTAMGSDDVDYSSVINIDSDDCVVTDGTIDTSTPGTCHITYTAVVEGKMTRETITVKINPIDVGPVEGPILAEWHWDTDADLEGWTKYEAGGGSVTESVEDGALKLEVVSGGAVYESRYEFMGLPFENGQAYEITFRAKASVEGKGIHFQVGELIASDPYFWDFKPGQVEDFKLTTEFQEFTFSFIYNKDSDSGFGGPLFEMGNFENAEEGISSIGIDCTIWIDDLVIKGGSGEDTTAPEIMGAEDVTLFIGDVDSFDPLAGVTATDYPDVDLTDRIIVSGDTVDVTVAGVYFIYYVVLDDAYNQDRVARTVTVMEDTEGPVFSGVEDVVYFLGDGKDALTDVMAMDNRDGDVTADIVLSGDTFDPLTEGTYTVTYTVEDALGNVSTVDRVIELLDVTFIDSEEIVNGTFDAGSWHPYWEEWNGADAFFSTTDDGLVIDIAAVGGNFWHVLIEQEGFALEANKTYRLSFDAMSTVARDIQAEIAGATGITIGGEEFQATISLTDTMTTYTLDIVVGDAATGGTLKFLMGLVNDAAASVITLDNVMLEEWDGAAIVADTDQVMDGSFDEWQTTGWGVWSPNGNTTFQTQWREGWLYYDEANGNPWENKLEQGGISMTAGLVYRLTFKAKGDVARDFVAGFYDGANSTDKSFELGTDFQTYTFIFTYTGGSTALLEFKLGQSSDNFAGTLFIVDDVMLEVEDATVVPEWQGFGGTTVVDNGDGSVDVTYNVTTEWWWDFSAQHLFLTLDGSTFNAIDFTFTGEVGQNYKFKVEYDGGAKETGDLLADGTEQMATLDLSTLTPEQLSSINKVVVFPVGNGTVTPITGTVVVSYDLVTIAVDTSTLADLPNQDFAAADISAWGTEGTLTLAHDGAGHMVVTVTELGANPWDQNIGSAGHNLVAGNTYEVTYVLRTAFVEGRDVTFFVENTDAGYAKYFEETRTLTDAFQTFTFTFTPTENNDDTKIGIFFGNTTNPLIGDVIIDSITVTETEPVT